MKGFLFGIFLCFVCTNFHGYSNIQVQQITPPESKYGLDIKTFVDRHNYYRTQLGIPKLEWSNEIADYAKLWAERLAQTCDMQHRKTHQYGENIYWTSGSVDELTVVDRWASEKEFFDHKKKIYEKGVGRKYGHYTQVIWKHTTKIGAAMVNCPGGGQIWVCNYDPPGNYIGQEVY